MSGSIFEDDDNHGSADSKDTGELDKPVHQFVGFEHIGGKPCQEDRRIHWYGTLKGRSAGLVASAAAPKELDCALFVVADGVGGNGGGDRAAQIVVDTIYDQTEALRATLEGASWDKNSLRSIGMGWLAGSISIAHASVRQAQSPESFPMMGAATLGALILGDLCLYVSAGDCMMFQHRQRRLAMVTNSHSVGAIGQELGLLNDAQAKQHPQGRKITSFLGRYEGGTGRPLGFVQIEDNFTLACRSITLKDGDRILLTTDGLPNAVGVDNIAAAMNQDWLISKVVAQLNEQAGSLGDNRCGYAIEVNLNRK